MGCGVEKGGSGAPNRLRGGGPWSRIGGVQGRPPSVKQHGITGRGAGRPCCGIRRREQAKHSPEIEPSRAQLTRQAWGTAVTSMEWHGAARNPQWYEYWQPRGMNIGHEPLHGRESCTAHALNAIALTANSNQSQLYKVRVQSPYYRSRGSKPNQVEGTDTLSFHCATMHAGDCSMVGCLFASMSRCDVWTLCNKQGI